MQDDPVTLRPYSAADETACIALWERSWQQVYPEIDFTARRGWWRERWRDELVPQTSIVVAECGGAMSGFATVDCSSGYLDQIVVAPDQWGSGIGQKLLDEAKRLSPSRLDLTVNTDNARAIRFYERQGFVRAGDGVNPHSGRPVHRMTWKGELPRIAPE